MNKLILTFFLCLALIGSFVAAASSSSSQPERVYHLSIDYKTVSFTGKQRQAMAINGSIPAPTLTFKEGEKAIIHVHNKMDEETSIHWHGILLPNFQDGVPYLTSPPIRSNKSHKFEFVIRQGPGTYWYHSHTGLQEQRGLYGAFIIEEGDRPTQKGDKKGKIPDLTLLLSDWTDKDPREVLRSLKSGDHYSAIQKGALPGLFEVIRRGAFWDLVQLWGMRMEGADISDVYYPVLLINGKLNPRYENLPLKKERKLRLRVINGSASTYFQLAFGGVGKGEIPPLLVAADGLDVQPVPLVRQPLLHAVAETYDFILQIPKGKALEFKAMAQDGSKQVSAVIGKGKLLKAPTIKKPDMVAEIQRMAALHRGHSHHTEGSSHDQTKNSHHTENSHHSENSHHTEGSHHHKPSSNNTGEGVKEKPSPEPHHSHSKQREPTAEGSHHSHSKQREKMEKKTERNLSTKHHKHSTIKKEKEGKQHKLTHKHIKKGGASEQVLHESGHHHTSNFSTKKKLVQNHKRGARHSGHHSAATAPTRYSYLKSLKKTSFAKSLPVKEIELKLTGNMKRYIWSFNGIPLSESDKIPIKQGEIVRLILNNQTMMSHPLHLHGHFFRVLNGQGDHSPLKHTVDVPPMESLVIEFAPEERGDWFFHCHILYHMKAGMSRIFSHSKGGERDPHLRHDSSANQLKKEAEEGTKNKLHRTSELKREAEERIAKNKLQPSSQLKKETEEGTKNKLHRTSELKREAEERIAKNELQPSSQLKKEEDRDPRLKPYPLSHLLKGDRQWFAWGAVALMSHQVELEGVWSNLNHQLSVEGAVGYLDEWFRLNQNFELEFSYQYFLSDFFRLYGAFELENHREGFYEPVEGNFRMGFKYLLPGLLDLDLSLSTKAGNTSSFSDFLPHLLDAGGIKGMAVRLGLDYDLLLLPRLSLLAEGVSTFHLLKEKEEMESFELEYHLGLEYRISEPISLMGLCKSHFGCGAGVYLRL